MSKWVERPRLQTSTDKKAKLLFVLLCGPFLNWPNISHILFKLCHFKGYSLCFYTRSCFACVTNNTKFNYFKPIIRKWKCVNIEPNDMRRPVLTVNTRFITNNNKKFKKTLKQKLIAGNFTEMLVFIWIVYDVSFSR